MFAVLFEQTTDGQRYIDWLVSGPHVSTCLKQKDPLGSLQRGGFDVVRLNYDRVTGNFQTQSAGCYLSQISSGGTHTITIHPSGNWISSNTSFTVQPGPRSDSLPAYSTSTGRRTWRKTREAGPPWFLTATV